MSDMIFTSEKRENFGGGWYRTVKVGDQEYSVAVKRGKMVRIPYKPRGKNYGYHWYGSVYKISTNSGRVWEGRVAKSAGVRGMMIEAGIINNQEETKDGD